MPSNQIIADLIEVNNGNMLVWKQGIAERMLCTIDPREWYVNDFSRWYPRELNWTN